MEPAVAPRALEPEAKLANIVEVEAQVSESVGTSREADLPDGCDLDLDREVDRERRVLNETPFG